MKIDVSLLDSAGLSPICSWDSPELLQHIKRVDDVANVFSVDIDIGGVTFSAFAHSLYFVVLDLLINHRIIIKGFDYSFFISDRPLFSVQRTARDIEIAYFNRSNKKITKQLRIEIMDAALSSAICHGMGLLAQLSPEASQNIWRLVYDDMDSENRKDFLAVS